MKHEYATWQGTVEADSFRNFLGVRTRCSYLPPSFGSRLAGKMEGSEGVEDIFLQDPEEWEGLLRSVRDASGFRYVAIELGAGWGPWVVAGAVAARQRGIDNIRLVAVEGDATHVEWIRSHFLDNGLNPNAHKVLHAVVGTYDGTAKFPTLGDPTVEWGGEAIFAGSKKSARRTKQYSKDYSEIPCISLPTLLEGLGAVDFIHFDIQGSELDVIPGSIGFLNRQVKRIVVGTHGRDIERSLRSVMKRNAWELEIDRPAAFKSRGFFRKSELVRDGTLVWRNTRDFS